MCPFWKPGDTSEPRPECPNQTFTIFSANALTKEGRAHKKLLDEQDQILKGEKRARDEEARMTRWG
jgi:hypothetical protein